MKPASSRVNSLDAFRGLTIAGMILVNNPGNWNAVFAPLAHAEWNGCTFADLVFPWFLFILGVAMPLAFARRTSRGDPKHRLYGRIVRRTAILIGLGLALNVMAAWPVVSALRIPGVLQRIGLVYLATALIVLHAPARSRGAILAVLLLGHWWLLEGQWARAHGYDLAPGDNVAAVVDRTLLGSHLLNATGDPEGLLGTLPATATTLAGTIVGEWFLVRRTQLMARLVGLGASLMVVGYAWSTVLPLNKSLWTGSYALLASGGAALGLAAFHAVLDQGRKPGWTQPLLWLGANPLAIYFASEIVRQVLDRPILGSGGHVTLASWLFWNIARTLVPGNLDERWVALAFGLLAVATWTVFAGLLYKRQVRIRV